MEPIADAMLPRLLSRATRERRPDVVERVRAMVLGTRPAAAAAALRGMAQRRDQTDILPLIKAPTLIIVGSEDSITPPSDAEAMHGKIEGSRLLIIEGAGHVSNIERPAEFNRALVDFLNGLP
jgi:pimeloyl-ACP methyl ester carboxylesterase